MTSVPRPAGTFPSTLQPLLRAMYDQGAITAKMDAAGATFSASYAQLALPALDIAGTPTGLGTEVMNVVTNNYSIVLQLDTAAGELGVTNGQLIAAIESSPVLAASLASLLTEQPVVRRDTWEASYAAVRKLLFPQL
jgi:hypothetical protein